MTSRSTRLAATFDRTATQLASIEASISSAVRTGAWLGPDAESFRGSWDRGMESQLAGLSARLTPDADWSVLGGPGAVMADTVTDVVDHLSRHSEQRTKLEGGEGDPHQALLVTARIAGSRIVTSRVHFPPSTADTDRPLALAILGCLQTARPGPTGLTAQPARAGAGTRTTAIRVAERRTSWGPSAPGVSA